MGKRYPAIPKNYLEGVRDRGLKNYKSERGMLGYYERENKKWADERLQPDVKRIEMEIEWRRSRTWGNSPHLTGHVVFADGTFDRGEATASGCGYDKHSTVMAEFLNEHMKGMLWRAMRRKGSPYGVSMRKGEAPYFEGGVGYESTVAVMKWLGFKCEEHHGRIYDSYVFTR